MKIAALILNYNDSLRCVEQANKLSTFNLFNEIVIVDNKSNSEQIDLIKKANINNVTKLYSEINKGYGAGNNIGLRYLSKKLFDFVFLVNTDIIVEKKSIQSMIEFLKLHKEFAAITCPMIERNKIKRNYYDFPNLKNSFFDSVTIESDKNINLLKEKYSLNQLTSIFSKLSKKCYSSKIVDNYITADFIRESCTLYNFNYFKDINFFDEDFFLYEEGPSICMNFKANNLKVGMLMDAYPSIHNHRGNFFNRKTFAAIKKSRIHFFKKYLKYPWYKTILIKIFYINVYLK